MYRLKVKELLEQQDKTPYWLSKQTGIAPNNVGKTEKLLIFDSIPLIRFARL